MMVCYSYGLSYTSFDFLNLALSELSSEDAELCVHVSVSVRNIGAVGGSEVVQLYVSYPPTGVTIPHRQLRGFAKVHDLAPGELKRVSIILDRYAFSYWDLAKKAWVIAAGTYGIYVGDSSENLLLEEAQVIKKKVHWTGV